MSATRESKRSARYWNGQLMDATSGSMRSWQEVLVKAVEHVEWSNHYLINVGSRDLSWARMVADERKRGRND